MRARRAPLEGGDGAPDEESDVPPVATAVAEGTGAEVTVIAHPPAVPIPD